MGYERSVDLPCPGQGPLCWADPAVSRLCHGTSLSQEGTSSVTADGRRCMVKLTPCGAPTVGRNQPHPKSEATSSSSCLVVVVGNFGQISSFIIKQHWHVFPGEYANLSLPNILQTPARLAPWRVTDQRFLAPSASFLGFFLEAFWCYLVLLGRCLG